MPVQFRSPRPPNKPPLSLPKKPKPWSHQDELAALRGKQIEIRYIGGAGFSGPFILEEADAYALKLRFVENNKSKLTYKHAIAEFRAL